MYLVEWSCGSSWQLLPQLEKPAGMQTGAAPGGSCPQLLPRAHEDDMLPEGGTKDDLKGLQHLSVLRQEPKAEERTVKYLKLNITGFKRKIKVWIIS